MARRTRKRKASPQPAVLYDKHGYALCEARNRETWPQFISAYVMSGWREFKGWGDISIIELTPRDTERIKFPFQTQARFFEEETVRDVQRCRPGAVLVSSSLIAWGFAVYSPREFNSLYMPQTEE